MVRIIIVLKYYERILARLHIFTITSTYNQLYCMIALYVKNIHGEKMNQKTTKKTASQDTDKKYITFFNKSIDAMLIIEGYNFVDCNRAAMSMLNYDTREEMLNLHPSRLSPEFQYDGQKSYDKAIKMMDIAYENGAHFFKWDHKCKNGDVFPVEVSLTAISTGKNKVLHTVWRDISLRKKIEEEKKELLEQLHRSQKMEAIGLMAGGVAHDLNNILSGIVTLPEILLMDLTEDNEFRETIKDIRDAGMRAAEVVSDLLVVARGITTIWETVNLNVLIAEYLNSPEGRKTKTIYSDVAIETVLEDQLLNISCSPIHIKKCLMNLVMNAAENIENKGLITISTSNMHVNRKVVKEHVVKEGNYAVIRITDTGTGIDENDIDHIFEPFYTKKFLGRSGTGLGLAIVWNTVQDHGGWVTVESSERGTTFKLYFPVTVDSVKNIVEPSNVQDLIGNGECILVVDDDKQQRDVANQILTALGYSIVTVSSGEEAVEYIKEYSADLIILDMIMELGINGRKTYEEIIKIKPGQKAIITSGFSKNKEVKLAQKLGVGQFVKKPYVLAEIGVAVKETLGQ